LDLKKVKKVEERKKVFSIQGDIIKAGSKILLKKKQSIENRQQRAKKLLEKIKLMIKTNDDIKNGTIFTI
jgi:hypothetical protein